MNQILSCVVFLNRPELLDVKAVLLMPMGYQPNLKDLKNRELFKNFQRPLLVGGITDHCFIDGPLLKDSPEFFHCRQAVEHAEGGEPASEPVYVFHFVSTQLQNSKQTCLPHMILAYFVYSFNKVSLGRYSCMFTVQYHSKKKKKNKKKK